MQVLDGSRRVESDADCPDLSLLERWLLTNKFSLIPTGPRFVLDELIHRYLRPLNGDTFDDCYGGDSRQTRKYRIPEEIDPLPTVVSFHIMRSSL